MSLKKYFIAGLCLANGITGLAIAADKNSVKSKNKKSPAPVSVPVKKMPNCDDTKSCYKTSRFQIGPYLSKDQLFDGSELIINTPTIREAARLLRQQYQVIQDCLEYGIPLPKYPRVSVSGLVEAQLSYVDPYTAGNYTRFNFDSAELDLYVQATKWLSAYGAINYDPSKTTGQVFMNRGFITLGDLSVVPLYVSAGKMYVPFGRYASSMVTEPYTRDIGRTRVNAIEFGFQQPGDNAAHAEVYLYQGVDRYLSNQQYDNLEYGTEAGYQFNIQDWSGELGTGAISNLGDSSGLYNTLFQGSNNLLVHRVPAYDVYGSLSYKKLSVLGEYLTALRHFAATNFAYNDNGARPSAFNTEVAYAIKTFGKPSSVGVGFSKTYQAVELGLPKNSYRAVYNINIIRNTNLAVEYRHDTNYSLSDAGSAGIGNTTLGKSDNAVTAQFDYFF